MDRRRYKSFHLNPMFIGTPSLSIKTEMTRKPNKASHLPVPKYEARW